MGAQRAHTYHVNCTNRVLVEFLGWFEKRKNLRHTCESPTSIVLSIQYDLSPTAFPKKQSASSLYGFIKQSMTAIYPAVHVQVAHFLPADAPYPPVGVVVTTFFHVFLRGHVAQHRRRRFALGCMWGLFEACPGAVPATF